MTDAEIAAMRENHDRHHRAFARRRVMLIEKADGTWRVEDDTPDGVAPQSEYPTALQAAARMLQLLGLREPVKPQDWPEEVRIGRIDYEGDPPRKPDWKE